MRKTLLVDWLRVRSEVGQCVSWALRSIGFGLYAMYISFPRSLLLLEASAVILSAIISNSVGAILVQQRRLISHHLSLHIFAPALATFTRPPARDIYHPTRHVLFF